MKFMIMCCTEEKKLADMPKADLETVIDETSAYCEALHKSGTLIVAEALEPVDMATTVRVRNGKLSATDGPFAETKEQFGGYHVLECRDMEEALALAERIPTLPHGGVVEVRAVESAA